MEEQITEESENKEINIDHLITRLINSLERREGKLIDRIKKEKKVVRRSKSN